MIRPADGPPPLKRADGTRKQLVHVRVLVHIHDHVHENDNDNDYDNENDNDNDYDNDYDNDGDNDYDYDNAPDEILRPRAPRVIFSFPVCAGGCSWG